MEQLMGQIMLFGGNFPPRGWALCDGQLLPIASNSALFSILGTTYGGDGRTTFGLPDLRGRAAVHAGRGPGLSPIVRGQKLGAENVTLTVPNIPSHSHAGAGLTVSLGCNEDDGNSDEPSGKNFGIAQSGTPYNSQPNDASFGGGTVAGNTAPTGSNQAFNVRNPFTGVNYIIALTGIYPSRS
ncbi:tail fiber protein [Winogradskyella sp.]|uniref:phage tail protein n=1 Tax=Winogradskyella sp. TaxID=1883156 RepID=UPI0025DB58ED|nr:tail fiber protein [Winogradskyella sp.]